MIWPQLTGYRIVLFQNKTYVFKLDNVCLHRFSWIYVLLTPFDTDFPVFILFARSFKLRSV